MVILQEENSALEHLLEQLKKTTWPSGSAFRRKRLQHREADAKSTARGIGDASLLPGHSKQEITKRVYRRIGATAKPSK
ncbi:hypothetical protein BFL40_28225 [Pseudomonas costantinii]|uniref:Integrase n=1 Tax=Pseudomonas costantinii TaxID=168469 RepID=A0A1S2UG62_9PSED|nr:hypothetical protein BFL40_28225 [Pseudomonas costantinii]